MAGLLLVPVHLDALCLETDLSVVEAKCDFSRLPYWDGEQEVNPDVANISEELLSRPFQDRGLQLRAGVHLHWSLPDALTRGVSLNSAAGKLSFPAVPNRWLVTRSGNGGEWQWIVESDFLHPDTTGDIQGGVAVPFPSDPVNGKHRPYRYLGRKRVFNAQWTEDQNAESLAKSGYQLTAVGYEPRPGGAAKTGGYGEPTFAAFYPNCQGVFGFHDPFPPATLRGIQYEVIGWYSDPSMDCLQSELFLNELDAARNAMKKAPDAAIDAEIFKAALEKAFKWQAAATGDFPDRIVCYARLEIAATETPGAKMPEKAVTVAVGNTGAEALSAYLAATVENKDGLLEDRLEALGLSSLLDGKELDVGLKFLEARHDKGFTAVPGGTMWIIRQPGAAPPPDESADETEQETLPDELASLLNKLNQAQDSRDRAARELESMRRRLFADWYKYMLCAYPPDDARDDYPDVDETRHFIEKNGLLPIKRQRVKLNALDFQCGQAFSKLSKVVEDFNQRANKTYAVQASPAQRYWRPNEPALLIVDETVEPTERHGQDGRLNDDGLLECQILHVTNPEFQKNFAAIRAEIGKHKPGPDQERIGFSSWTEQPWNPFMLEWSVEMFPRCEQNNLDQKTRDYDPEFITTNYKLDGDAVDLTLKPGKEPLDKAAMIYSGASLLTPHAKLQLRKQIEDFLKTNSDAPAAEAVRKVYEKLDDPGFHAMAQTLNGFNEALLMRKQTLQFPIADPMGFDDARSFTEAVREAVGDQNRSAPQPLNDFNPIRAGVLKILDLRLVDTFGRTQNLELKDDRVFASEAMSDPRVPSLISLPPRLVQPARLNFRWLSADRGGATDADEPEMNAHPGATPVCGWLIPNNLDDSLMVYDSDGGQLGSINTLCEWTPAPGSKPVEVERIGNFHLKKLVKHLIAQGRQYYGEFLTALDEALENIDPESSAQHEALALLMGRPIAIVRATLDLELLGQPAINQDWNVFRLDLERDLKSEENGAGPASRDTDKFTKVIFPIRLGDGRQLNDGLVGYWMEDWAADGETYSYKDDCFYVHAPGAGPDSDERLRHAAGKPELFQAIDDPPQKLTMLVDPRGCVHATSGVLPVKEIRIPPDQFADALRALEVTFLSTPILTPLGSVNLPLPAEPGYAWSWLYKNGDGWAEFAEIKPANLQATWSGPMEIREGWLKLTGATED